MIKKRTASIFAVVAILIVVFFLLHRADQSSRSSLNASTASLGPSPAGTWQADTGDMFQFRTDGTGRSYDPNEPTRGVHYFEWTCDAMTLTIYYAPRGRIKNFIAYQTGIETASFGIDQLTPDTLVLSDGTTKTRFTSATDAILDADP